MDQGMDDAGIGIAVHHDAAGAPASAKSLADGLRRVGIFELGRGSQLRAMGIDDQNVERACGPWSWLSSCSNMKTVRTCLSLSNMRGSRSSVVSNLRRHRSRRSALPAACTDGRYSSALPNAVWMPAREHGVHAKIQGHRGEHRHQDGGHHRDDARTRPPAAHAAWRRRGPIAASPTAAPAASRSRPPGSAPGPD